MVYLSKRVKRTAQSTHNFLSPAGRIEYLLKRSSARRTLCITIDERSIVQVAAPFRASMKAIEAFISEKSEWILNKIQEAKENRYLIDQKSFTHGQQFLFLGKECELSVLRGDVKRARIEFIGYKWNVIVSHLLKEDKVEEVVKKKMIQWYRQQAEEILGGRIFHYGRIMGRVPKKIAIRTQKRIWGCCDYRTQTIHLNWQIILSPMKVIDYIVLHEMCHLFVPNHSKRFWNKVGKYMPEYDLQRKWLKINHYAMMLP